MNPDMMNTVAQEIIDAQNECPIRVQEARRDLAKIRIKTGTNGNEICNGLRLLQLIQIRRAIDKLDPKELFQIREFFLLACAQPLA